MTFDITLERPDGTGGSVLVNFEDARGFLNAPHTEYSIVTTAEGEQKKVPSAAVVSVDSNDDETSNDTT